MPFYQDQRGLFFTPNTDSDITRRVDQAQPDILADNIVTISNFFDPEEASSARAYFESISLEDKIITRTEGFFGFPVKGDLPSESFTYERGRVLLAESKNFIGTINRFLGWMATKTNSDIQLYSSSESMQSRRPYVDSAFICNKLVSMNPSQAEASFHQDYPHASTFKTPNNYQHFTVTVFITSDSFTDVGFGTQFAATSPQEKRLEIPCRHLQVSIFDGSMEHGFLPSNSTTPSPSTWRASVTWKCRAIPLSGHFPLLKDLFTENSSAKHQKTRGNHEK